MGTLSLSSLYLISIPDHMMSTPYLTSPDLVQCEVTLPGTPYKEIIYKQFQIEQTNNNNSVTMASDCQLRHGVTVITLWIVIIIHVHVYSCFS